MSDQHHISHAIGYLMATSQQHSERLGSLEHGVSENKRAIALNKRNIQSGKRLLRRGGMLVMLMASGIGTILGNDRLAGVFTMLLKAVITP